MNEFIIKKIARNDIIGNYKKYNNNNDKSQILLLFLPIR